VSPPPPSGRPASRYECKLTNFKWIQFDATAAEVEDLLIAEFFVWEHVSGTHDISTESYHVPTHIQEHIDYVTPGTRLRQRNLRLERNGALDKRVVAKPLITQLPAFPNPNSSVCDIYVTAECTRGTYFLATAWLSASNAIYFSPVQHSKCHDLCG
jgi:tripeptidyl-peptidase I